MLMNLRNAMMAGKRGPKPPAYWGLYFEAEEPGVVVNMSKNGSVMAVTLETSTDGTNWTAFDPDGGTTPITLANVGDKVFFRAGPGGNTAFATNALARRTFTLSGLCGAHGNIMSLLDGAQMLTGFTAAYVFPSLFRNCENLVSAPELPAITLTNTCYRYMFYGCINLVSAPELLAVDLVNTTRCYSNMFEGCTKLRCVRVNFTSWEGTYTTVNWLSGVAASGTFECPTALGTDATITRGISACPEGWTVVNID